MKRKFFIFIILYFIFFVSSISIVLSQNDSTKINLEESEIKNLKEEIKFLKEEVRKLKEEKKKEQDEITPLETPPNIIEEPAKTAFTQTLNPDISVITDFLWTVNHNKDTHSGNAFNLREVELGLQQVIDPFSRADIFTSIQTNAIDLEEGYITFLRLPWRIQSKVGKMRASFGKANLTHPRELPYTNLPSILTNYFGEEGLSGTGIHLSALINNPWDIYSEIQFQILNAQNNSFNADVSGHPLYLTHFKNFFDLTEDSALEIGVSAIKGFNDLQALYTSTLSGANVTYKWIPLKEQLYKSFILQGEFLHSKRGNELGFTNSNGFYLFSQYQLNRGLFLGTRYDYAEYPDTAINHEKSGSLILTYFPSEFSRYQLEYKKTARESRLINELFFHFTFTFGIHRPHPY